MYLNVVWSLRLIEVKYSSTYYLTQDLNLQPKKMHILIIRIPAAIRHVPLIFFGISNSAGNFRRYYRGRQKTLSGS